MTSKNNTTKIILAGLIALLVLIIAVVATVLVRGRMKENQYNASIDEAKKFVAQANYEQAIVSYRNAIELDPADESAYISLADVYIQILDYSKARSILKKGYRITKSRRIKAKLDELEEIYLFTGTSTNGSTKTEAAAASVDLATASSSMSWDASFLQKIRSFTFDDYKSNYGPVTSAEMGAGGYLEVRHQNLGAVTYYRNTADNSNIVDETRKTPAATAMPEKISVDSLDTLFNQFEGAASLERMQLMFGERVQPKTMEGKYYIEYHADDLVARIGTDQSGNLTSSDAWNEIELTAANKSKSEANVKGVIVDAVTGAGVPEASVSFRPSSFSGETVTESTDSSGAFELYADPGSYEVTVTASGYIEEQFRFEVNQGQTYTGEQFIISPELGDEARIVLEWNEEPRDLDSYLEGSADDGTDMFVSYFHKKATNSKGTVYAELDVDDTSSYGPETITIHNLEGVYTYTVVDFLSTGTMAQKGATVKVYLPGESVQVIDIDPGLGTGNIWEVLTLDHGKLTVSNQFVNRSTGRDSK